MRGRRRGPPPNAKIGSCDMCGAEGQLFRCEVEGTNMDVCKGCGKYGSVKFALKNEPKKKEVARQNKARTAEPETYEMLVENCAELIKAGREKLNLTQAQFAKRINEKESLVHAVESKKLNPSFEFARKLEKFLKISLIETHEEKSQLDFSGSKKEGDELTLGDFIKVRKRK